MTENFIMVSCLSCFDKDQKCKSCQAWQYFLFNPSIPAFIDLRKRYMVNVELDMPILIFQFDQKWGDRSADILRKVGLKDFFDGFRDA